MRRQRERDEARAQAQATLETERQQQTDNKLPREEHQDNGNEQGEKKAKLNRGTHWMDGH